MFACCLLLSPIYAQSTDIVVVVNVVVVNDVGIVVVVVGDDDNGVNFVVVMSLRRIASRCFGDIKQSLTNSAPTPHCSMR